MCEMIWCIMHRKSCILKMNYITNSGTISLTEASGKHAIFITQVIIAFNPSFMLLDY